MCVCWGINSTAATGGQQTLVFRVMQHFCGKKKEKQMIFGEKYTICVVVFTTTRGTISQYQKQKTQVALPSVKPEVIFLLTILIFVKLDSAALANQI